MQLWHAILLGLVQGLTEFLPVSSTAHLTLTEHLLLGRGMPLAFDVLLHVGTLLALFIYFRKEIGRVLKGLLGRDAEGRQLAFLLFLAMIPTIGFGLLTRQAKEWSKQHLWVYGVFLLVTAWMLYRANLKAQAGGPARDLESATPLDALKVGSIQGLGGGFGLSRSGSTISMGVFSGMRLPASARFSFLLGIPTILGAAVFETKSLLKPLLHHQPLPADMAFPALAGGVSPAVACIVGVVVSALSGYLAIGLLDRFTRSPRLNGFAFYCLCVGALMVILGTVGIDGLYAFGGIAHR
ncbi:MAG TPA: undecaprenyl-diphosphate phosphatase [Holophagaceae bacterium]|nr:undecaprenyl-diphosphate phosphatase [Holophagaceae bacterium]